jgi:periplasmic protein CpxP/Spy
MIRLHTPLLAAALFTGVAAVGLTPVLAQTASGANAGAARHHAMPRTPGQFVDGRIAFFKTELKITPTQEAQWQQVEAAMRENAKALDQAIATARQNRPAVNAIQHLELRDQFAKVRSDNDDRFLAAFKPLYGSLSPDQQKMADQMIAHQNWRHHRA